MFTKKWNKPSVMSCTVSVKKAEDLIPPAYECDTVWKQDLCWYQVKIRSLGWAPIKYGMLIRRRESGHKHIQREEHHVKTQRQKELSQVKMRQRLEWCSHKPKNAWSWRRQRGIYLYRLWKKCGPADTLFHISFPQNCETMKFGYFKLPILW